MKVNQLAFIAYNMLTLSPVNNYFCTYIFYYINKSIRYPPWLFSKFCIIPYFCFFQCCIWQRSNVLVYFFYLSYCSQVHSLKIILEEVSAVLSLKLDKWYVTLALLAWCFSSSPDILTGHSLPQTKHFISIFRNSA